MQGASKYGINILSINHHHLFSDKLLFKSPTIRGEPWTVILVKGIKRMQVFPFFRQDSLKSWALPLISRRRGWNIYTKNKNELKKEKQCLFYCLIFFIMIDTFKCFLFSLYECIFKIKKQEINWIFFRFYIIKYLK